MGVTKHITKDGNGVTSPRKGDTVTIDYTGYLYDDSKPSKKGTQFDSSKGRGDFVTKIGVGQVIRGKPRLHCRLASQAEEDEGKSVWLRYVAPTGWDEGVMGMSLGEKATLIISSDYAYGDRGFPGRIPPGSTLVFDVELKKIN
ncbi:MAG: FK506 binding protein proline rotamase rapamycin-binding protein [Peltula sp. TS41687]|nr:MAG: FK506 binding protein proline rotamase rapamycin-binding protein [Peltula sp. TS41687]